MKINGSHKFKATSKQVYNAILDPTVLQSCIPGCSSVAYLDSDRIRADIAINLPGVSGTFGAIIYIAERQEPNKLTLQVQRQGKVGSINATSEIDIADEADGSLLTYNATADLAGAVAIANNPIGQGITKNTLNSFFEKLDKELV
jgi:carbon monoxide dehydrogenase subunit G